MVSAESLAFVDLMRRDDMDRRASQVKQAMSSDERGEPTHEDVSDSGVQESTSDAGDDSESVQEFQEQHEDTTPAEPVSEVGDESGAEQSYSEDFAPADPLVAVQESGEQSEPFTGISEAGDDTESAEIFQEQYEDTTPAAATSEVALGTEPLQGSSESGTDEAEPFDPSSPESASVDELEAFQAFSSDTYATEETSATQEAGESIEPSEAVRDVSEPDLSQNPAASDQGSLESPDVSLFSEDGQPAEQARSLQDEGVQVTEINSPGSETVILEPEKLPDFAAMLLSFDRNYHPPDPQAGDDIKIPSAPEIPDSDPIKSSTEVAELMIADMSEDFLNSARRKP